MLIHWVWFATLPKLSRKQKLELLSHYPSPEDLFYADRFPELPEAVAEALENKDLTLARSVIKDCAENQVSILTMTDAGYPSKLKNIQEPPLVLYYKGVLPDFEGQPVIGVVGTRKASPYGMTNAGNIAKQIALCGGLIVSGGAGGVDTAALQAASSVGKQTVVILGGGVNEIYPKSNRNFFERIVKNGCLMSEYLPNSEPKAWQFPERNRIISGLSNGVVVVEAPEQSGALITARDAFEQGRDVYAVPGNIGVATCAGSNALLREFATAVFTGWDVLKGYASMYPDVEKREMEDPTFSQVRVAETKVFPNATQSAVKKSIDNPTKNAYSDLNKNLSEQEKKILGCLENSPKAVDEVIAQAGLPVSEVLRILTTLALKGVVTNHPGRMVSANYR